MIPNSLIESASSVRVSSSNCERGWRVFAEIEEIGSSRIATPSCAAIGATVAATRLGSASILAATFGLVLVGAALAGVGFRLVSGVPSPSSCDKPLPKPRRIAIPLAGRSSKAKTRECDESLRGSSLGDPVPGRPYYDWIAVGLSPKELKDALRSFVCLGENGHAALTQDLHLRVFGHLLGNVSVADSGFAGRHVLLRDA